MKNDYNWWLTCPCGYSFEVITAENWRGAGGELNRIECQCPKCKMWIDANTGEPDL